MRLVFSLLLMITTGCVHLGEPKPLVKVLKQTETSVLVQYTEPTLGYEQEKVRDELEEIGEDSCMEGYEYGEEKVIDKPRTRTIWERGQPKQECSYTTTYDSMSRSNRSYQSCRTVWPTPQTKTEFYRERIYRVWILCNEEEIN